MKILFMGRKDVSARLIRELVSLSKVEIIGVVTDSHLSNSPTKSVCKELGVPLFTLERMVDAVRDGELQFDLGLSVVFWRRIPKVLIDSAKLGIINFHPAPLPEFKGTGGYNLAVLRSLTEWAISAHYVDEDFDTGPIISVSRFPIDPDTSNVVELERETMGRTYFIVLDTLREILAKKSLLKGRDNVGGEYISRQQMEAMKQIAEGDDVERKVRAFWFPPYRGAYVEINGQAYTLVTDDILRRLSQPRVTNLFEHKMTKKGGQ